MRSDIGGYKENAINNKQAGIAFSTRLDLQTERCATEDDLSCKDFYYYFIWFEHMLFFDAYDRIIF